MIGKVIAGLVISGLVLTSPFFLYGQTPEESQITEGEFAVEIVAVMKLKRLLPPAATQEDCITLLEGLGVSPLMGWDPERILTDENRLVIINIAAGRENLVKERAREDCDNNVSLINTQWQLKYDLEKKWGTLEELLEDRVYFPEGPPVCLYGKKYISKDGEHKVEPHHH